MQTVLLFGSEKWELPPRLEKALDGFHHQGVQWMVVMGPKFQRDGTWVYTPIREVLEMVGLEEIGLYISHRKNMISQYIVTCPIMESWTVYNVHWSCVHPAF